jgi:hypothetical protein
VGGAWAIQPEVLYVRKGTTFQSLGVDGNINLDYLDIPVLLKLNLIPSKTGLSPFIEAGPSLSLNTSAKETFLGHSVDLKDMVNGTDFGLVFGGGLDIQKVTLEVRYEVGLGHPFKEIAKVTPDLNNGTLYALLGYKFF